MRIASFAEPHLGKVIDAPAGVCLNRSSPGHSPAATAGDRPNRWYLLHWMRKQIDTRRVKRILSDGGDMLHRAHEDPMPDVVTVNWPTENSPWPWWL